MPRLDAAARPLDRRSFLRYAGLTGVALGAGGALAACGGSSSSTSTGGQTASPGSGSYGDIALQLSWIKNIEFAGEFFADSKGYYEDAGFKSVNLLAGGSAGSSAEAAVASGKAWAGLSSPTITAPAIGKGAKIKIVGATYQKNPFCILSIARNPIPTPQDMVGKKIGVQSGGNDVIFKALLSANGIDPSSITVVPVQYDPSVVVSGEVDGFMSYITNEPIILASRGQKVTTFLLADYKLPLVAETYVVKQSTITDERAKLKAFLKAEVRGWKDAYASPQMSADLAVNTYGKTAGLELAEQLKEATAQNALITSTDTQANGLFTMTDALISENVEALGRAGITTTADQLFDLSVLQEMYSENPDLKSA